jgi:O-antigen/teichoic acid export membrane protein
MSNFWRQIISSTDTASSKRLVTLIIALHFIVACFAVLFICFYVIFYLPKGRVEPELVGMLKQVLEYDFYIILSGLGFITIDNMGQIMLEKAKAKVAGNVAVGSPSADTIKVQNLNVEQKVPEEPKEDIFESEKPE